MKRRTIEERFWAKVQKGEPDECWMWTAQVERKGYGKLACPGKTGSPLRAHRVAWEIEHGPIPDGLMVLHRCDRPGCVNHHHLFLGTASDNSRDMAAKGRSLQGTLNPASKFPWEVVVQIRALHATGEYTYSALAKLFGTSLMHTWNIVQVNTRPTS